jgi:hypothetical protein
MKLPAGFAGQAWSLTLAYTGFPRRGLAPANASKHPVHCQRKQPDPYARSIVSANCMPKRIILPHSIHRKDERQADPMSLKKIRKRLKRLWAPLQSAGQSGSNSDAGSSGLRLDVVDRHDRRSGMCERIVILVPYGVRTGGPECCFQLSDALIRLGYRAETWLITRGEEQVLRKAGLLPEHSAYDFAKGSGRLNPIDEYAQYRFRPFSGTLSEVPALLVLPEIYAWAVPLFRNTRTMLWWLSADNAFSALGHMNINHLRLPGTIHAAHSVYARNVVASLGMNANMLSDYTVVPELPLDPVGRRPMKLCLNAGGKVIFNLGAICARLIEALPELEIVPITNLPRTDVYRHFSTSRLFVDLGSFPGKDRMVREALVLGANVVVAAAGAGRNSEDYVFPDAYRWDMVDIEKLVALVVDMLTDPENHQGEFATAREIVRNEKAAFDAEVETTFRPLCIRTDQAPAHGG